MVEFAVDKALMKKIDLMINRVMDDDEQDNYLIIEGETGSGKTNASVGIAHLVAQKTGRPFDVNHVFFDTNKAIDFAKRTSHQIIIFDEPAFSGLKAEWRNKTQINLVKLIFTSRKKRHFVIFNLVKFSKFNDDIIEKAMAFIRVYKRSETKKERRFLYIPHKKIENLLDYWKKKHKRAYKMFSVNRGTLFRYVLPEIIDKDLYEKMKDEAIETIGNDELAKENKQLMKLKKGIYKIMKENKLSREYVASKVGVHIDTISGWNKYDEKDAISIEEDDLKGLRSPSIINNGFDEQINQKMALEGLKEPKTSTYTYPETYSTPMIVREDQTDGVPNIS